MFLVTVQPSASLLRKSSPFKVCFQQRAGFFDWIYTFLRTLPQVQSPGLNSYLFLIKGSLSLLIFPPAVIILKSRM